MNRAFFADVVDSDLVLVLDSDLVLDLDLDIGRGFSE